ncbi:MAG: RNase adapter RapZ [Oscillospiraceae bacterium]|nr:RNase adapter RapZ [Oscillospiraceae bacterium]
MRFAVVTGISGSGKTQVARILEDIGFFCIDNMPPALIPKLVDIFLAANGKFDNVALVVDIRIRDMFKELDDELKKLKNNGYKYTLLYLDADDKTIIKRYKETRRVHPLASGKGLLDSIKSERNRLEFLLSEADHVIDTSGLTLGDLSSKVKNIFMSDRNPENDMKINVMSFGFKYGVPIDADLVFDVRCFPNPFYVDELKELTGNDNPVRDYVLSFNNCVVFLQKLYDMLSFLIPLYTEEGKSSLTVAIGCTGGKHRSVTMANMLGEMLEGYDTEVSHRDIMRGRTN